MNVSVNRLYNICVYLNLFQMFAANNLSQSNLLIADTERTDLQLDNMMYVFWYTM